MTGMGSIDEPERCIRDTAVGLECHIYGHAPVQADGRLVGHPLYFRARHDGWSFTLSLDPEADPAGMGPGEQPGFFRAGEFRGYAQWGDYGTGFQASYMPYEVAERLIRQCSEQYLAESKQAEPRAAADPAS